MFKKSSLVFTIISQYVGNQNDYLYSYRKFCHVQLISFERPLFILMNNDWPPKTFPI